MIWGLTDSCTRGGIHSRMEELDIWWAANLVLDHYGVQVENKAWTDCGRRQRLALLWQKVA